jgi:hypothetical protein
MILPRIEKPPYKNNLPMNPTRNLPIDGIDFFTAFGRSIKCLVKIYDLCEECQEIEEEEHRGLFE